MTKETGPISYYLAPALLVLGTLLAAGNWYRQPERAGAWVAAIATLAVFAVVWGCMTLVFRRWKNEAARRHAAASIRKRHAQNAYAPVSDAVRRRERSGLSAPRWLDLGADRPRDRMAHVAR